MQPGVDFAQQFAVAFRHRNTEILTLKFGIRHQLELLLRVLFDVVLHHPDVANRGADAVLKQLPSISGVLSKRLIAVLFLPSTSETTISPVLEFTTPTFVFQGRQ